MRRDIQDALLSVAEVAIFAWSLLELLLTRVLPLAVYLVGHLLLQTVSLLTSVVVTAAAGPRQPQAEYSWEVLQAEELINEEKNAQVVKDDGDHQNNSERMKSGDQLEESQDDGDYHNNSEGLKSSDKLEESQPISREESPILPSVTEDENDDAAATTADAAGYQYDELSHVTNLHPAANGAQARGSKYGHLAESSPSNDNDQTEAKPSNQLDVVSVKEQHVSSKVESSSAGKMDSQPSDGEARKEATSEERTSPSTEGGMQKTSRSSSRRRRMRVLPPSLSQVKRTLMQRSRRTSPSPHTSPATLAPSPSPIQKKRRGSRRSASSASSYDNFVHKFRKHFLLDAASPPPSVAS